ALVQAEERLGWSAGNLQLFHKDFRSLPALLNQVEVPEVDGLLLDLGVSSPQLDTPSRGFSFQSPGPLDMRMDRQQPQTAADLVNSLPEDELSRIFRQYGEEPSARRIASAILRRRRERKFTRTDELAQLVEEVKGGRRGKKIHPATRVFQALRIAVNRELEGLAEFLHQAIQLLKSGGRLVVISFHSLEDRLVKRTLQKEAGRCVCRRPPPLCDCPRLIHIRILTRKPVAASQSETAKNPRARSAKLRAAEKLDPPDPVDEQKTTTQYNPANGLPYADSGKRRGSFEAAKDTHPLSGSLPKTPWIAASARKLNGRSF
ncbi:MAG: 16S rRNA (cytosine(1402)-N(4))-methyltransferase RsmH, partial [Acidobacteriota bacterium]